METQPDTVFEDQVLVITYRTRDRLGPLQCKLANCLCISSKEVEEEIKGLSPAERGFISVSDRLEMNSRLNQLALQRQNEEHLSPHFPGQVGISASWRWVVPGGRRPSRRGKYRDPPLMVGFPGKRWVKEQALRWRYPFVSCSQTASVSWDQPWSEGRQEARVRLRYDANSLCTPPDGAAFFPVLRKQILKFLDAEKDISVLKGTLKPGDVIHYVFDRDSTMNVSQNLYELLPRTSPLKGKQFPTCAIVGNSGVLLSSGCGPEIDAHSFVIRWGTAPSCGMGLGVGAQGGFGAVERGWSPGCVVQRSLAAP